jgi:hypothetical protein
MEMNCQHGLIAGYLKPLFLHLVIFNPLDDAVHDNPLQFFWQAVVGTTAELLKNRPRDQLATSIPISGNLSKPQSDILATIGNVLRNAFIRAYLPRLEGAAQDLDGLEFGRGSIIEPPALEVK